MHANRSFAITCLYLAMLPSVAAPVEAGCEVSRAWVDAMVIYFGSGYWSASVCPEGDVSASASDTKVKSHLTVEQREVLSRLVAALPKEKKSYRFGVQHVDLPALVISVREQDTVRKYFVADDVQGELANPDLLQVARLAFFMRSVFQSRTALDMRKWLAPVDSERGQPDDGTPGQANDQMQRTRPAQAIKPRR